MRSISLASELESASWCGAVFNPGRTHRYLLWRIDNTMASGGMICWVLLNPSTADETKNDPTVERCVRRSCRLGYRIVVVANAFALRSTDPAELRRPDQPVPPAKHKSI